MKNMTARCVTIYPLMWELANQLESLSHSGYFYSKPILEYIASSLKRPGGVSTKLNKVMPQRPGVFAALLLIGLYSSPIVRSAPFFSCPYLGNQPVHKAAEPEHSYGLRPIPPHCRKLTPDEG